MVREERLELLGYRDDPVPNRFLRQDGAATRAAILFPGLGYTCDMPLFYYTTTLLLNLGCDVLRVEYDYRRPDFRKLSAPEQLDWIGADARPAFDALLHQARYDQLILVGKSLGTRAMGHVVMAEHNVNRPLPDIRAVWLTPLLRDDRVLQAIQACGVASLTIIGTADPHFVPDVLNELAAKPEHEILTVDGADHSLDIGGDTPGSLRALAEALKAIEEFLAR